MCDREDARHDAIRATGRDENRAKRTADVGGRLEIFTGIRPLLDVGDLLAGERRDQVAAERRAPAQFQPLAHLGVDRGIAVLRRVAVRRDRGPELGLGILMGRPERAEFGPVLWREFVQAGQLRESRSLFAALNLEPLRQDHIPYIVW